MRRGHRPAHCAKLQTFCTLEHMRKNLPAFPRTLPPLDICNRGHSHRRIHCKLPNSQCVSDLSHTKCRPGRAHMCRGSLHHTQLAFHWTMQLRCLGLLVCLWCRPTGASMHRSTSLCLGSCKRSWRIFCIQVCRHWLQLCFCTYLGRRIPRLHTHLQHLTAWENMACICLHCCHHIPHASGGGHSLRTRAVLERSCRHDIQ